MEVPGVGPVRRPLGYLRFHGNVHRIATSLEKKSKLR
jgi:hypothetical protein